MDRRRSNQRGDSGSSSAGRRGVLVYRLTGADVKTGSEGWAQGVQRFAKIRAGNGRRSAMPSSAVAWHLASLAAVECRVVEEGAAVTAPVSSFEILVSLRCGLGGLLPFFLPRIGWP